jgi:hypothetical protein
MYQPHPRTDSDADVMRGSIGRLGSRYHQSTHPSSTSTWAHMQTRNEGAVKSIAVIMVVGREGRACEVFDANLKMRRFSGFSDPTHLLNPGGLTSLSWQERGVCGLPPSHLVERNQPFLQQTKVALTSSCLARDSPQDCVSSLLLQITFISRSLISVVPWAPPARSVEKTRCPVVSPQEPTHQPQDPTTLGRGSELLGFADSYHRTEKVEGGPLSSRPHTLRSGT